MSYADQTLTCRDCGKEFTFTGSEQELFVQKGYNNYPSRCNECRAARKSQRGGQASDGESGSNRRESYSGGGQSRGPREMFSAICSECGQTAQVPFQPRTDKPVYCSNCFEQQRSYR